MSELGFERRPTVSHSEMSSGHDVTHLLSSINQNYKQSKADQILRLLHDQDKLNDELEEIEDIEEEYNKIREEKVVCDSDTLTDSSSDRETVVTIAEQEEVIEEEKVMITNQKPKEGRSKTSIGFYGFDRNDSGIHLEHESDTMGDKVFDTRDLSIRPKSSYVRRGHLYRKNTEVGMDITTKDDLTGDITHRSVSAKNRPKSRLGRDSLNRRERKIEMVEATPVTQAEMPAKDDGEKSGTNASVYKRFERTRTPVPRRGSKRTKGFCEDNTSTVANTPSHDNQYRPHNVHPVYTDMETSVQDISGAQVPHVSNVTKTPVHSILHTQVPANSPLPSQQPPQQHRQVINPPLRVETHIRNHHERSRVVEQHPQHSSNVNTRSDTVLTAATSIKKDNTSTNDTDTIPLKRTSSISNTSFRPKNPEPISSRPMGRPDLRPNTRQRRLTRRYMQQTQSSMNSVRPTSESVILARQKTEKNLLKKQADNRPHSEKIVVSNKTVISVSNNPAQGPQTNIMSKEGVTQSVHVGTGGFRGYDPGQKMKPSSRSRDIPADLTLPRSGQGNVMFGARKPLALMKLPPLEASLAAKKKERGLTLAQRETCV